MLQWCLENQCGKADTCMVKHSIHHPAECPEIDCEKTEIEIEMEGDLNDNA